MNRLTAQTHRHTLTRQKTFVDILNRQNDIQTYKHTDKNTGKWIKEVLNRNNRGKESVKKGFLI